MRSEHAVARLLNIDRLTSMATTSAGDEPVTKDAVVSAVTSAGLPAHYASYLQFLPSTRVLTYVDLGCRNDAAFIFMSEYLRKTTNTLQTLCVDTSGSGVDHNLLQLYIQREPKYTGLFHGSPQRFRDAYPGGLSVSTEAFPQGA